MTVQDQIRLWELERNRTKTEEGYLYREFATQGDFELVLTYAKEQDLVLWENSSKRMFVAKEDGHGSIRGFIERRRQQD